MINRQQVRQVLTAAVAGLMLSGAAALNVRAADSCPEDIDLCVFVNSNLDTDTRDDLMTLREALLVTNGTLSIDDLTSAEAAQVVINMPPGWGPNDDAGVGAYTPPGFGGPGGIGSTSVYFDPSVFCAGCPGNTIVLTPPGFGGPGGIGGSTMPLIPALPAVGSDGAEVSARLGMGYENGAEKAVSVRLDGTALGSGYAGLTLGSDGNSWVRGITLTGFAGSAVQLVGDGTGTLLLGSNNDGEIDEAEVLTYQDNLANVVTAP
jgi:hypothetical protein